MKLYSYIITSDSGFAPNPFFGYCTLACCKAAIRRAARVGDWIVALAPKKAQHRIVCVMSVDEKLSFQEYWLDARFKNKKPRCGAERVRRFGDNIYKPVPGGFRRLPSMHSRKDGTENNEKKDKDLRGEKVLVWIRPIHCGAVVSRCACGTGAGFCNRGGKLVWFEQAGKEQWKPHVLGELPVGQLGSLGRDVDGDGDPDVVSTIWRAWPGSANSGKPHVDWLENLRRR